MKSSNCSVPHYGPVKFISSIPKPEMMSLGGWGISEYYEYYDPGANNILGENIKILLCNVILLYTLIQYLFIQQRKYTSMFSYI